jgi:hypothetical protein
MTAVSIESNDSPKTVPGKTGTPSSQVSQTPAQPDTKIVRALKFIHKKYRLVQGDDGRAYAVEKHYGNPQAYRIDSTGFGSAIRRLVHTKDPSFVLVDDQLNEIRNQLKALADLSSKTEHVWYRVAQIPNGVEIDVGDTANTRIIVTPGQVKVLTKGSKTLFYRTVNMKPFVIPAKVGALEKLLPFLNLVEDDQWLLIAWITYTLSHGKVDTVNFLLLVLFGDRGAGKSTLCNLIISLLVDPSLVGVQAFPSKIQDFAIATQNAHVLFYDNLRRLTKALSDALCITCTSGYLSNRKLYSDDQESIKKLHCAIVLNGIHPFIEESDLAQRILALMLLDIDPATRTTETKLAETFNRDLPEIFRGLLDLISRILTHLPSVNPIRAERMLDFVRWLAAMELALGFEVGKLQRAYSQNLVKSMQANLENDPLAIQLIRFAKRKNSWSDTPTKLLVNLTQLAGPDIATGRDWPANGISLSLRLKSLRSQLSGAGVDVQLGRQGNQRNISIHYTGTNS